GGLQRHGGSLAGRGFAARAHRGAGGAYARGDRRLLRGRGADLWRAGRARRTVGGTAARPGGRSGGGGGDLRRALAGDGGGASRDPQGGRRLPAARSRLPGGPPEL